MNHKKEILKSLEHISGGIAALKTLCKDKDIQFKMLLNSWDCQLYDIIEMIEEDDEKCQKPLKNSQ